MRLTHILTGWVMTIKELFRSRIIIILLFVIPTFFYIITLITTTKNPVAFKLATISDEIYIQVSQRSEALIFIGLTAVGLLASFLALNLMQRSTSSQRRLIVCGYRSSELAFSKFLVLLCVVLMVGCYVASVLPLFFPASHFVGMVLGFMLMGFVYGSYGMLIGSFVRGELEGILFIVLLANLDVGWLQNPIFYAEAQNRALIRNLPAFLPSQVSMVSAFSDHPIGMAVLGSLAYGSVLLLIALFIFWRKMRKY